MKKLLAVTAIAASLLVSNGAMADLSPEAEAKADAAYAIQKERRMAFETPATTAALYKARAFLNKPVPGRECDNASDAQLICDMEDGVRISVEAVPTKTTKAEAEAACINHYAEGPQETSVEMKGGNPKQGFTLLWCVTKADAESKQEAEERIADYKPPGYLNKETYTCAKDTIQDHMSTMIEESVGHLGVRLVYVKNNPVETSRNENELRCRIEIATNKFKMKGIFRFYNEDDHNLVGWEANKSK